MSSSPSRRLVVVVVGVALVLLAAVLIANAADEDPGPESSTQAGSSVSDKTEPGLDRPARGGVGPERHVGPQGRVGQFVAHCGYSHSAPDDPIVHFGHSGRSHRHDFYGSTVIDASSTPEILMAGGTTCDKTADTAGYWHPTLFDRGEIVVPRSIAAYYRAAPGVDPTDVVTMPTGLALIAGDQTATEPQAGEAAGWVCGTHTRVSDDPPDCPVGAPLHLILTFQDCWDGRNVDSEDHKSHVAYSVDGRCPSSHPVNIPQLTVSVAFPISGPDHDLTLASGNIYSAHGDFFNGWDPDGLEREINRCIHRDVVCDLASNREEEPLFSG
ncbi:MAG: DUF1996 domain-containing protein [Microthrixaceae bacterium]|nr:DUF1996 domain-containing protein [Acidimicrobiales bacterium]MCB9403301.1 DUF1996 domain-containing protein [Microthrixaceae bacterium]